MDEKLGGETQTEDEAQFMPQNNELGVNKSNEKTRCKLRIYLLKQVFRKWNKTKWMIPLPML